MVTLFAAPSPSMGSVSCQIDNFLLLLCDCRAHDGNGLPMCPWEEQSRLAHSDGTYQSHEFALVATPGTDATLVSTASS